MKDRPRLAVTLGHEGCHVGDWKRWIGTHRVNCPDDTSELITEIGAWNVGGILARY